jgi:hypothetical protein
LRTLTAAALLLLFVGCASGPKFSAVRNQAPALRSGESRIFVYRTSSLGGAVQPDVRIDEKVASRAVPGKVTFVDIKPGKHSIACTTEKTNSLDFDIAAGETKYIELVPYFGILIGHIDPQLVPENKAEEEIKDLRYMTSPLMKDRVPAGMDQEKQ